MTAYRTPEDRFASLDGFQVAPHYVDDLPGYEGLRIHHVDVGPADAPHTFLCLHGEPTWSYLYRKMLPALLGSGARVVIPDLLGFGRSDKPEDDAAYRFAFHRDMLLRLTERLDPRNVTLVVQDWGGTLGLTLPVDPAFRARLRRLVVMNTVLPVGQPLAPHYYEWRSLVRNTPDPPVGAWMRQAAPRLTDAEQAAYDAPFPEARAKAGPRTFPDLAMVEPGMDGVEEALAALRFWGEEWSGETFMAVGGRHPDAEAMGSLRAAIRGCPEPLVLPDVGHFVPEEAGDLVARAALQAFGAVA